MVVPPSKSELKPLQLAHAPRPDAYPPTKGRAKACSSLPTSYVAPVSNAQWQPPPLCSIYADPSQRSHKQFLCLHAFPNPHFRPPSPLQKVAKMEPHSEPPAQPQPSEIARAEQLLSGQIPNNEHAPSLSWRTSSS